MKKEWATLLFKAETNIKDWKGNIFIVSNQDQAVKQKLFWDQGVDNYNRKPNQSRAETPLWYRLKQTVFITDERSCYSAAPVNLQTMGCFCLHKQIAAEIVGSSFLSIQIIISKSLVRVSLNGEPRSFLTLNLLHFTYNM